MQTVRDDVVGVSVDVPSHWRVYRDPVLFSTHGFVLFDPRGPQTGRHERSPVARVALAYQAAPRDIERLVRTTLDRYAEFPLRRYPIAVGGRTGTAISGLPGTDPFTQVYVADGDRVYRIGLWSQAPQLGARERGLLASLRFEAPARSVWSLGLKSEAEAVHALPPADQLAASAAARAQRAGLARRSGGEPRLDRGAPEAPISITACEFGQPDGLFWQTVWDYTNRFYTNYTTSYSGTYYNERPGDRGWSAMSGNGGSWWGQNYHIRKCEPFLLNQFYANDWPVHLGGNVYPAIVGRVEWAGWDVNDSEGYYTLGRYVVVRNGSYRALMAHLSSIAPGISWGASVGMNTIIGYAGRSGGPWDEHVHSRVAYGESLTSFGQPYGGNTVWPRRLRCVDCRATDAGDAQGEGDGQFDLKDSTGAKYYTRFYYGRWMRP
jgi:hypothetical protein